MEIEYNFKGETIKKELQLKGKHIKKAWKLLQEMEESKGSEVGKVNAYTEYIESVAQNLTGISLEDFDDMLIEEQKKIIEPIGKAVEDRVGFIKPSQT